MRTSITHMAIRYLAIFWFFLISCHNKTERRISITSKDSLVSRVKVGNPKLTYIGTDSQAVNFEKAVGLDNIRQGYDSLQLRIWKFYGFPGSADDSSLLLVIKRSNGKWDAEILKYVVEGSDSDSTLFSIISRRRNITPVNGWEKTISELLSIDLLNKPFEDISEGKNTSDGGFPGIEIEIATQSKYESYSYFIPDAYKNSYWQIEDLRKLLELVNDRFGF